MLLISPLLLKDWRGAGQDTARTWALQMTIDILGNGPKRVFAAKVSGLPKPASYWPLPSTVYAIAFELLDTKMKIILLANTNTSAVGGVGVTVAGAAGAALYTVDEASGVGGVPYRKGVVGADGKVALGASAYSLLVMA